jgi:archaellum biogenesis ATPase FlaH
MADAVIEGIRERVTAAIRVNVSVGIQVPENRHADLLEAIFASMCKNTHDMWSFVTVSKSYDYLKKSYKEIEQYQNIRFIDCISRAAGITAKHHTCTYIESPGMLEFIVLELLNSFHGTKPDTEKFIVIDSLSALMIYNDPQIIREFITLLMNRARSENIHVISILVEEEMDSNKIIQMNDKIIVLRDSFID